QLALHIRCWTTFDETELQLRSGLDDVLHARRIVDTRKLNDDAIAALRRDQRLGDAKGVYTIPDRLDGVIDRVALDRARRRRFHFHAHRTIGRAADIERCEFI